MLFEKELNTFRAKRAELNGHEGEYALIHGDQILGLFDKQIDALNQGRERFGPNRFLVQMIEHVRDGCSCPGEACHARVR